MTRCKGSRAGHTRAGVGHQGLNKASGQAKKAEHDPGQGQSKDFMGEMRHWKVLFFYLLHCVEVQSVPTIQYSETIYM